MTPTDWHYPMKCPGCKADAGRPFSVQSKSSTEVIVHVRCSACSHQWTLERDTPNLAPSVDQRHSHREEDAGS